MFRTYLNYGHIFHRLATIYTAVSGDVKRVILRALESPVRTINSDRNVYKMSIVSFKPFLFRFVQWAWIVPKFYALLKTVPKVLKL